jgi:hypothetical protein
MPARHQRYADLLATALPPGYQLGPSHQARWLWRTLHGAELAGLDARQLLIDVIAERDLTGAREIAAVIDARIRRRTGTLIPHPPSPWSAQPTGIADPERRAYARQIAALMDARKQRIGEHAAATALPWAVGALGPVPDDPLSRSEWQQRAASIGAYRELSGYNHPTDPVGPEPAAGAPDLRAAWHEALAVLAPAVGPDVRGMTDGTLLHLRATYRLETAWAPPWAGNELRQSRVGARDARLAALRAAAEAAAASQRGQHHQAARHQELAASYQALHAHYRKRESALTVTMADRADWEQATHHQRQLAVAADAELRRRHPGQPWPPLRSAEPEPVTIQAQQDHAGPNPFIGIEETRRLINQLATQHREISERLAARHSMTIPAADPDFEDVGLAFPAWTPPGRHPILQPPKPAIPPSEQILGYVIGRETDREAAD